MAQPRAEDMKRRKFITLLGAAAMAWPRAARAQQGERMRRIGVLMPIAADDPAAKARLAAFQQDLQQLGWTDGRNVRIETRWSKGHADAFANTRPNWPRFRPTSSSPQVATQWGHCYR